MAPAAGTTAAPVTWLPSAKVPVARLSHLRPRASCPRAATAAVRPIHELLAEPQQVFRLLRGQRHAGTDARVHDEIPIPREARLEAAHELEVRPGHVAGHFEARDVGADPVAPQRGGAAVAE